MAKIIYSRRPAHMHMPVIGFFIEVGGRIRDESLIPLNSATRQDYLMDSAFRREEVGDPIAPRPHTNGSHEQQQRQPGQQIEHAAFHGRDCTRFQIDALRYFPQLIAPLLMALRSLPAHPPPDYPPAAAGRRSMRLPRLPAVLPIDTIGWFRAGRTWAG